MQQFAKLVFLTSIVLLSFQPGSISVHADEKPAATARPRPAYAVYTWRCTRSLRLTLATDSLHEAHAAAEKARKDGARVEVTTGAYEQFFPTHAATRFEVHQPGCKGGWKLVATTRTRNEAESRVEAIQKKEGTAALLVAVH